MSDPGGWVAPKIDWAAPDGIAHTDLNRIETDILGIRDWLKQGGDFEIVTVGLPGGEKTGTVYWEKHAQGIVVLRIPELLGTTDGPGGPTAFSLDPVVAWPSEILVDSSDIYYPVQILHAAASIPPATFHKRSMGAAMELPYHVTTVVTLKIWSQVAVEFTWNFGIYEQYITYYTHD